MNTKRAELFKHKRTGKVYGSFDGKFYRFKNGGQWFPNPFISDTDLVKLDLVTFAELYRTFRSNLDAFRL